MSKINLFTYSTSVELDGKKFYKEMDKIENRADGFVKNISNMSGAIKKAFVGASVVAVGKLAFAIGKDLVGATNVQIKAETRLESIAKKVTKATDGQIESMERLAAAQQKVSTFGDEVLICGQSQLLSFGMQAESAEKLTQGLADLLAANKGMIATQEDAINSANLLGKAFMGQAGALSRVGILLDDHQAELLKTGDEMTKINTLIEIMNQNYGGLAESYSKMPEGKFIQLQNEIGDLKEELGEELLPVFEETVELIGDKMPEISKVASDSLTVLVKTVELLIDNIELLGLAFIALKSKAIVGFITMMVETITMIKAVGIQMTALCLGINATALAVSGLTLGIGAAVAAFILWNKHKQESIRKNKELIDSTLEHTKTLDSEITKLDTLTSKYKYLQEQKQKGIDVDDELLAVQRDLASVSDSLVTGVDKEGNAISDNIELAKRLLAEKKKLREQEIEMLEGKAKEELPAIRKEKEQLQKRLDEINKTLDNGGKVKEYDYYGMEYEIDRTKELQEEKAKIIKQQKEIIDGEYKWLSFIDKRIKKEDLAILAKKKDSALIEEIKEKLKSYGLVQEDIDRLVDEYNAKKRRANEDTDTQTKSLEALVSEYNLLNKANKEFEENGYLSAETMELLKEKFGDAEEAIGKGREGLEEFFKTHKDVSKTVIENEVIKTNSIINEIKKRIEAYQAEMDELEALINNQEMAGTIDQALAEQFYMQNFKNKSNAENRLNELLEENKEWTDALKGMNKESKKSKSSTKPLTESLVELDNKFLGVKNTLASLNKEIEKYQSKLNDSSISDKERIATLLELNNLYAYQKIALTQLESEYMKEQSRIKGLLGDLVKFDEVTGRIIEMPSKVTKEQADLISSYQEYGDKISEVKSQMISLNQEQKKNEITIKDLTNTYFKSLGEMQSNIDKLNFDIFKENTDMMVESLEPLSNEVSILKEKLGLIEDSDFDNKLAATIDIVSASKKNVRELRDEFDRLADITPKNAEEAEYLADKMSDLSKRIKDGRLETAEYERSLEKLKIEAYITKPFENSRKVIENELSMIDNSLKMLEEGITSSIDLDDALAFNFIPETEHDKLVRENKRIFDEYESHEEKIARLKEYADEERLEKLEDLLDEEEDKQRKHLEKMSQELINCYIDQNEITVNQLADIGVNVDSGMTNVVEIFRDKWEEIAEIAEVNYKKVNKFTSKIAGDSSKSTYTVPGYSKGGGLDKDQLLAYGEEGRELVILPNGEKFLSPDRTSLAYLPQGTQIIPNQLTEQLLSQGLIKGYAKGTLKGYLKSGIRPTESEINRLAREKFRNYKRKDRGDDTKGEARRDYESYWKEVFGYTQGDNTDPRFTDGDYDTSSSSKPSKEEYSRSFSDLRKDVYNVSLSKSFKGKYENYKEENEDYDDLIDDMRDSIDRNNPEQVQELLDKIDEQTMLNIDIYSDRKIDLNEQLIDNLEDYIDDLEDAYDEAEEGSEEQLEIQEELMKANKDLQQAQLDIHQAIKDRYEYQFKMMDKELNRNKDLQDDIKDQISLLDDTDYSKRLEFTEDLLESEKEYNESLQDNISLLKDQMRKLEVGSYEWNILNGQVKEYEELLEDSNIKVNDMAENLAEIDFDRMMSGLDDINKSMGDLQYELDIQTAIDDSDINAVNKILERMNDNTKEEIDYLYEILDQLESKKGLLNENSDEWDVIVSQIDRANEKIREGNLELIERSKKIFSSFLGDITANVEVSNPRPTRNDKKDDSEFIDGLEKELEIEKIRNFVEKHNLKLSEKQLSILNSTGKIKKNTLEMCYKELELQQLQLKLDNLRNQKTVQQLQQLEDGTFDFVYVADQDEIDKVHEAILDKQLEMERQKNEDIKKQQDKADEESYQSQVQAYDKKMDRLQDILEKAETRGFRSAEEFREALLSLGLNLPIDEMVSKYADYFYDVGDDLLKTAVNGILSTLKSKSTEFEEVGNESGKAYVDGIADRIDKILEGEGTFLEKQKAITDLLAAEFSSFALVGNESGMKFISGLIDGMEIDGHIMDFDRIGICIRDKLSSRSEELKSSGQEQGVSFIYGLISEVDKILANGDIEDKTKEILELFDKKEQYGSMGSALGESFMDNMISVLEDSANEMAGKGEGAVSQAVGTITQILDNKIIEFQDKGDSQGSAYAEALKVKLSDAMTNADVTMQDIIDILNKSKSFDLAGLLSGEAYGESLGTEFDTTKTETDKKSSAIVKALEEDTENFGLAGTAQGESYKSALVGALDNARTQAIQIVDGIVSDIGDKTITANVEVIETHKRKYEVEENNEENTNVKLSSAASGAYLDFKGKGVDGKGGKLIVAHPNEVISNPIETEQLLKASEILKDLDMSKINPINFTKNIVPKISFPDFSLLKSSRPQRVEQNIEVNVTLPNVKDGQDFASYMSGFGTRMMQKAYSKG